MIYVLFTSFVVKHFICDFLLQRSYLYRNKCRYGHPGGLLHATIHAVGTLLILVWISVPTALIAAFADGIIHYHIDWVKARRNHRLNPTDAADKLWTPFGFDQMLHYLTHIGITAYVTDAQPVELTHQARGL